MRLTLLRVTCTVLPDHEGLDRSVIFLGQDDERAIFQTHPFTINDGNSPVLRTVGAESLDLGPRHDGTELGFTLGEFCLLDFFSCLTDGLLLFHLLGADCTLLLVGSCKDLSFLRCVPRVDVEQNTDGLLHLGFAFDRSTADEHLLAGNHDRLAGREFIDRNHFVERGLVADDDEETTVHLGQLTPVANGRSLALVPVPECTAILGDFARPPVGSLEFVGLEEADNNSVFHAHFCSETSLYRALVDNVHASLLD